MPKKSDNFSYIVAIVALVVLGIFSTAIINGVKSKGATSQDIRARASVGNDLALQGTVSAVNAETKVVTVDHVEFAPESRSGAERDYGTWTVKVPQTFDIQTLSEGTQIKFTISTKSFNVAGKSARTLRMEIR